MFITQQGKEKTVLSKD